MFINNLFPGELEHFPPKPEALQQRLLPGADHGAGGHAAPGVQQQHQGARHQRQTRRGKIERRSEDGGIYG